MSEGQIVEALAQAHNVVVGAMERKLAAKNAEIAKLQATIDALTPDAKLGEAVRGMAVEKGLYRAPFQPAPRYTNPGKYIPEHWEVLGSDVGGYSEILGAGPTPEAALQAAGLWIKIKEGTDE